MFFEKGLYNPDFIPAAVVLAGTCCVLCLNGRGVVPRKNKMFVYYPDGSWLWSASI